MSRTGSVFSLFFFVSTKKKNKQKKTKQNKNEPVDKEIESGQFRLKGTRQ